MTVSARALSRGSSPRAGSGIADAAHGRLDAGLGQALAVLDRHILHAAVGVVDQTRAADRPAGGKCLLQRVEHKASLRRAADPPARSEEHTSELQSPLRISYAVFCLTKKNHHPQTQIRTHE